VYYYVGVSSNGKVISIIQLVPHAYRVVSRRITYIDELIKCVILSYVLGE